MRDPGIRIEFKLETDTETVKAICLTVYFLGLTAAVAFAYQLYF